MHADGVQRLALAPFAPLDKRHVAAITDAARAYMRFVDADLELSWS